MLTNFNDSVSSYQQPQQPIFGGLTEFKNNDALFAEAQKRVDEQNAKATQQAFQDSLSGDIAAKWERAKQAKLPVEQRMLDCKRACKSEYKPQKLAAIQSLYGKAFDPPYPPVIQTKRNDAKAWLLDYLCRPDSDFFNLEPTPLPDLPDAVQQDIDSKIELMIIEQVMMQAQTGGMPASYDSIQQELQEALPAIKEKIKMATMKAAKEAASNMKTKIRDQFAEGGLDVAMKEFIHDITTYPAAFLEGPIQRKTVQRKRELNIETGKWETKYVSEVIDTYERVSPFDVYPSPDMVNINDGYLFVIKSMSRSKLYALKGVEGYNSEAISRVLEAHKNNGLTEWLAISAEKAELEGKDPSSLTDPELIDCLQYQGSASGWLLREWGLTEQEIPDPDGEYQIVAWIIGNEIIKARLNEDPTGKKTIYKACYSEDPDSFWGTALPEILWDIQTSCNSLARSIVLNAGMASGPIIEYDKDRFPLGVANPHPFMKIPSTGSMMSSQRAITFNQMQYVADRLVQTYEFFRSLADEYSGIPRYMQGEKDSASKTASGLSMLISNSSRGLKAILLNIDINVIGPLVEAQYSLNLEYETDIEMIGDCKAVARGATSVVAKEQLAIRRKEFLGEVVGNQTLTQIVGLKGIRELTKAAAEPLDLDMGLLFEDDSEFQTKIDAFKREQMAQMNPQSMPQQGQAMTVNAAGDRSAGQDFALFQNTK